MRRSKTNRPDLLRLLSFFATMSTDSTNSFHGIVLTGCVVLMFEYYRCYKNMQKFEKAYWGERRGRAQVEREMKKISNVQLNTSEGFFVQPIGHIESCYRQCIGTPRQGMLVPESRATLKLTRNMSPEALDGLETFSHVWISFKFHLNTNTLKESKAFSSRSTFTAKISLPMLKGTQKVGVLATRSPHRPNPIGITLARVDRVDKKNRIVYLKACDLVHGTPVLDIKPYVPAYDTVENYRIPDWLADTVYTRNTVTIQKSVVDKVSAIQDRLVQFKNAPQEFIQALIETLQAEVRSKFQTNRRIENSTEGQLVEVLFDETVVRYNWIEERVFDIIDVELVAANKYLAEEAQQLKLEGDEALEEQKAVSAANEADDKEVQEQEQDKNIENNTELSF